MRRAPIGSRLTKESSIEQLPAHSDEPAQGREAWTARWVAHPDALARVPKQFVVHVSADNRYQLCVMGIEVRAEWR